MTTVMKRLSKHGAVGIRATCFCCSLTGLGRRRWRRASPVALSWARYCERSKPSGARLLRPRA